MRLTNSSLHPAKRAHSRAHLLLPRGDPPSSDASMNGEIDSSKLAADCASKSGAYTGSAGADCARDTIRLPLDRPSAVGRPDWAVVARLPSLTDSPTPIVSSPPPDADTPPHGAPLPPRPVDSPMLPVLFARDTRVDPTTSPRPGGVSTLWWKRLRRQGGASRADTPKTARSGGCSVRTRATLENGGVLHPAPRNGRETAVRTCERDGPDRRVVDRRHPSLREGLPELHGPARSKTTNAGRGQWVATQQQQLVDCSCKRRQCGSCKLVGCSWVSPAPHRLIAECRSDGRSTTRLAVTVALESRIAAWISRYSCGARGQRHAGSAACFAVSGDRKSADRWDQLLLHAVPRPAGCCNRKSLAAAAVWGGGAVGPAPWPRPWTRGASPAPQPGYGAAPTSTRRGEL